MYDRSYIIHERHPLWCFGLSIITFGIYALYWIYKLHQEIGVVTGRRGGTSPLATVVLCVLTCGIYQVWWAWQRGCEFREEARRRGSDEADMYPSLFLVLQLSSYLFGFTGMIGLALMQDRVNQILRMHGMGTRPYDENRFNHSAEEEIARRARQRAEAYEEEAAEDEDLQQALRTAQLGTEARVFRLIQSVEEDDSADNDQDDDLGSHQSDGLDNLQSND